MVKNSKKGISLIALVITIIVVVILAGAVILNITNGGFLDSAKKAKFMSDFRSVEEGVSLYSVNSLITDPNKAQLPLDGKLTLADKKTISDEVPTLKTKIEELNGGKSISNIDLYWISEPQAGVQSLSKDKRDKGYIMDVTTGQIYDYVGDVFEKKRWHTLDSGVDEATAIANGQEVEEVWDGWIRLTLYYPRGVTEKKWRLGTEGELRADQMVMWQDYTGPITIPLYRTKDVWISYKLNGKEVIVPPAGKLLVDIVPDSTGVAKVSKVNVKINYDEQATTKEYKINDSGWITYTGPFTVTENCIVEARAKKIENIYNTDGTLKLSRDIIGSDMVYIGNIGIEESKAPINELPAPIIERLAPQSSDEKARVKITYPAGADKSIYTVNYGAEENYSSEISIKDWGTTIVAYAYDINGNKSEASKLVINDTTSGAEPETAKPVDSEFPTNILEAPIIQRLPAVNSDEKARVKITYPEGSDKKIYTVNYGAEAMYSEEISIKDWGTTITAYAYDVNGNKSKMSSLLINDTTKGAVPEVAKPVDTKIPKVVPAPTITRLAAVSGDEKAQVKIEYPANAVKKVYKVNYGLEQDYTSEISIKEWGTNILAYYYDADGNMSQMSTITINDISTGELPQVSKAVDPLPSYIPYGQLPQTTLNTNTTLPQATITRLTPQDSSQKAVIRIDYPAQAVTKVYTINGGAEIPYAGNIPIYGWDTTITAYYYDAQGNKVQQKQIVVGTNPTPAKEVSVFKPESLAEAPSINIPSNTGIVSQVTINVTTPVPADKIYIKVGKDGEYKEYTGTITLNKNTEIYTYYQASTGEISIPAKTIVNNIKEGNKPYLKIDANPYPWPDSKGSKEVTIAITSTDANRVEYSEDGIVYNIYSTSFKITKNERIYARATNDYGVTESTLDITNIGAGELDNQPNINEDTNVPQPIKKLDVSINANPDPAISQTKVAKVTMSIEYDENATEKLYSIGKTGEIKVYTGPFDVTKNCTIYAYAKATNAEGEATKEIDNLLDGIADPIISTEPLAGNTASKVKVNIVYDKYATVKKYSINGGALQDYNQTFDIIENGTIIYAYSENAAGQKSNATYTIENIVADPPVLLLDKGSYYILKLNYPEGSQDREYKWKEEGAWKAYKDEGILLIKSQYREQVLKDGTLIKIEDENGNKVDFKGDYYVLDVPISELFENLSMRWDKAIPQVPTISIDTTATIKNVTATIKYEDDLIKKQYRILESGGTLGDWQDYIGPITIDRNNTVIYARGIDFSDVSSQEGTYKVTNIDDIAPVIDLTVDLTTTQRKVPISVKVIDNFEIAKIKWAVGMQGESYFLNNGTVVANDSTLDILENGYYTFYAEDGVGNTQIYTLNVTNIDSTIPENPVITANTTNWTNGNVTVTINYSTDTTTKQYSTDGITWNTYTAPLNIITNNTTVYARAIDAVGNQSGQSTFTIANIDKDVPVVEYGTNGASNVQTASTIVTVSDAESNINAGTLQYVWDTQNTIEPTSGWIVFNNGTSLTKGSVNGTYYLWIKATDNVGNELVSKTNLFNIDNIGPTNPTMSATPSTWTNGNVTVTINYSADTATKQYSTDGTTWNTYTAPITVNENNTTVYARAIDSAGNQSGQSTLTVSNIDKIAPTVVFGTNGGSGVTVSTTLTVSDSQSNINTSTLQYVWDTQNTVIPASGWTVFTNGAIQTKTGDGIYYLWVKGIDNVGNIVIEKSNAFRIGDVVTPVSTVQTENKTFAGDTTGFSYNNPVIPAGFIAVDTIDASWNNLSTDWDKGLVIQDISGNQFVWVPVNGTSVTYSKWCTSGYSYTNTTDDILPSGFSTSNINTTYKGFYIGRYEASFDYNGGSIRAASKKSTNKTTEMWSRDSSHTGYLWNYINYTDAKVYSEYTDSRYGYNTSKVGTNLITGAEWDTVMLWIQNSGKSVYDSRTWGNYRDSTSPANVSGYSALQISGYSNYWKAKNIYDLAGNIFEWTNEIVYSTTYVYRGSICSESGSTYPASSRNSPGIVGNNGTHYLLGFRVGLYVL